MAMAMVVELGGNITNSPAIATLYLVPVPRLASLTELKVPPETPSGPKRGQALARPLRSPPPGQAA
jgi:hypothetical protein